MKKFLLSLSVFFATGAYMFYQYAGGASASASVAQTQQTTSTASAPLASSNGPFQTPSSSVSPVSTQSPSPTPSPTPTPTPAPTPTKPKGQYADGSYTGAAADAYYGYVQVRATVSGGKLTDVVFLQYPNDRSTSRYINSQAMPLLKSEAIQAQSANVSGVSGASDTSMAFRQSLGDALAQAKNG